VAAGLQETLRLAPGRGYAELGGGWSRLRGGYAWSEVGARLNEQHRLFLRGEADRSDIGVQAGWRFEF
jgi:hypothetical protein